MAELFIGAVTGDESRKVVLDLKRANRHGLIAGLRERAKP